MSYCYRQFISVCCAALVIFMIVGCERETGAEEPTLKVGVIASLSGSERLAGIATVESARMIADYYNEQGGLEVDGERYQIELIVKDDAGDPVQAAQAASDFVSAGDIYYVIGPEEDALCEAVAPVLDSAGILYVYYGFSYSLLEGSSCGVLGAPRPMQLFSSVVDYLQENDEFSSICVLAGGSKSAMHQKLQVERILRAADLEVVKFSSFDVSEEIFEPLGAPLSIRSCMDRLVSESPDAVILCGQRDGTLSLALSYLRGSGYRGAVFARDSRVSNDLKQAQLVSEGLFLVSASASIDERSNYYLDLENRYLDDGQEWNVDMDVKLYALASILQGIDQCGSVALTSSESLLNIMDSIQFADPFLADERLMGFVAHGPFSTHQQLSFPILISKYDGGVVQVVHRSDLSF